MKKKTLKIKSLYYLSTWIIHAHCSSSSSVWRTVREMWDWLWLVRIWNLSWGRGESYRLIFEMHNLALPPSFRRHDHDRDPHSPHQDHLHHWGKANRLIFAMQKNSLLSIVLNIVILIIIRQSKRCTLNPLLVLPSIQHHHNRNSNLQNISNVTLDTHL